MPGRARAAGMRDLGAPEPHPVGIVTVGGGGAVGIDQAGQLAARVVAGRADVAADRSQAPIAIVTIGNHLAP